jgi:carboxyl-terminal processing protease
MQRNNGLLSWKLVIVASIILGFTAASAGAAPPMSEIRDIIAKKALQPHTVTSLATLDSNHLHEGLQAIDTFARYVPPLVPTRESTPVRNLGIEIFFDQSRIWARPDPGGPADKAGIPEIGELQGINHKNIQDGNLAEISAQLDTAAQKEVVNLTIADRSGGKGKTYKVRPTVSQPSSVTLHRQGSALVVRIRAFVSHDTAPGFSARMTELVRPGDRVLLDLRGCAGGDLFEALEIAGMFVPAGQPLISTYDRSGVVQSYRSPPGRKLKSPGWVLIDRRTASAAEILVGILQYHRLTRVVGERSYGKCVSQTLIPLSDGGGLWLTTLGVRFPDSTSCAGVGIKPDILLTDISIARTADILKKIGEDSRDLLKPISKNIEMTSCIEITDLYDS